MDKFYKVSEVAKMLKVSRDTVYKMIKAWKIKHIKLTDTIKRIPHSSLEEAGIL